MNLEKILEALSNEHSNLNDGSFFVKVFTLISQRRKKALAKDADNLKKVCTEEYDELSRRLDRSKLQESCSVRNILKTRRLANLLINDKGELNFPLLNKTITLLAQNLYSLGPNRQHDSVRQEHLLNALTHVQSNKDIQRQLKNIGKPYANKIAEQIISDTLQLPEKTAITDAHARRAALSALICYLRQNVGSCFATAPCILVHDEQPLQFLTDINELLSTGRLKRTWSGVEYSVPLSPTWGSGDLKKIVLANKHELAFSPGLMAACEVTRLINPDDTLQQKMNHLKSLINDILPEKEREQSFYISTEELLKFLLLKHFKISEKDLNEYQSRPQGLIQSSLMIQIPQAGTSSGGKGQACANFLIFNDMAKNAFKALSDNALLKAWEFTVASFAENKAGFTRWNLYSSLGLGPQEKGGIGQCLYAIVQRKLVEVNEKLKRLHEEHEQVYTQVKYMESRIKHASERESQWLKAEYQSKRNEFYTFQELKDKTQMKANLYANLFITLVQFYDEMFPRYFQEVYDADMQDFSSVLSYDDSPAGFRLLYKFGRSHTASWQRIFTPSQFVDALASFFSTTESEIRTSDELAGLEDDVSEIVTAVISHVRTREFIESAFIRMAQAHHSHLVKNPLENLDKIEKKPWSYTSGGSMDTLVATYFRRDQKPAEMSRWIESPVELQVFLCDILKQSPSKITEDLLRGTKAMLMQSPTHAFLLKPGKSPFKEGWQTEAFTYTWVRDNWIKPREGFIEDIRFNDEMIEFIVDYLAQFVHENFRHFFRKRFTNLHGPMKVTEFREVIMDGLGRELGLRSGGREVLSSDIIDGTLFSLLPLFSIDELDERVENILDEIQDVFTIEKSVVREIVHSIKKQAFGIKILTAKALQDVCKAIICLSLDHTCSVIDMHLKLAKAAQKLGYAMPKAIIFADTNWVKDYFAFVVNPGTLGFELWRTDILGSTGYPMSVWEQWLNGSQRQSRWGVYTRPHEYTF